MPITGVNTEDSDMGVRMGNPFIQNTPAPASYGTGPQTLLTADIIGGTIVSAGSGAGGTTALTLPTAVALAAALRAIIPPGLRIGDTLWCLIVNGNTGAGALVMTASAGVTFDTNQASSSQVIPQNTSKTIQIRFTNVTVGSEAYVVYS
jgi:hypothetical protein